MLEEENKQEYVNDYCKVCGSNKFVTHADNPDLMVCISCPYTKTRKKQEDDKET